MVDRLQNTPPYSITPAKPVRRGDRVSDDRERKKDPREQQPSKSGLDDHPDDKTIPHIDEYV